MRSRTSLTPIVSAGLAAVAAGSLFAFSLVAQRTGLPGLGSGSVVPVAPSLQLPSITLPGTGVEPPIAVESAPVVSAPITISELPADQASAPAARGGGAGPAVAPSSSATQRANELGKDRDRAVTVQEVAGPMSTASARSPTSVATKGKAYGHTDGGPGNGRGRDDHQGSYSRAATSESSSYGSHHRRGPANGHQKQKSQKQNKKN
jgi:hypothetical protein